MVVVDQSDLVSKGSHDGNEDPTKPANHDVEESLRGRGLRSNRRAGVRRAGSKLFATVAVRPKESKNQGSMTS
eukprot:729712-Rhodomonas_salina.1